MRINKKEWSGRWKEFQKICDRFVERSNNIIEEHPCAIKPAPAMRGVVRKT